MCSSHSSMEINWDVARKLAQEYIQGRTGSVFWERQDAGFSLYFMGSPSEKVAQMAKAMYWLLYEARRAPEAQLCSATLYPDSILRIGPLYSVFLGIAARYFKGWVVERMCHASDAVVLCTALEACGASDITITTYCRVDFLTVIAKCPSITRLRIQCVEECVDIRMCRMPYIKHLHLDCNVSSDVLDLPRFLHDMVEHGQLESLSMSKLKAPTVMRVLDGNLLSSIRNLDIQMNLFDGDVVLAQEMPNLKKLSLTRVALQQSVPVEDLHLADMEVDHWRILRPLKHLRVHGSVDVPLVDSSALTTLHLSGMECDIVLPCCPNLQQLTIISCFRHMDINAALSQAPHLWSLTLHDVRDLTTLEPLVLPCLKVVTIQAQASFRVPLEAFQHLKMTNFTYSITNSSDGDNADMLDVVISNSADTLMYLTLEIPWHMESVSSIEKCRNLRQIHVQTRPKVISTTKLGSVRMRYDPSDLLDMRYLPYLKALKGISVNHMRYSLSLTDIATSYPVTKVYDDDNGMAIERNRRIWALRDLIFTLMLWSNRQCSSTRRIPTEVWNIILRVFI